MFRYSKMNFKKKMFRNFMPIFSFDMESPSKNEIRMFFLNVVPTPQVMKGQTARLT